MLDALECVLYAAGCVLGAGLVVGTVASPFIVLAVYIWGVRLRLSR